MRVFLRDQPQRAVAIATDRHVLIFRHSPSTAAPAKNASSVSVADIASAPRCIVEFSPWGDQDMHEYRSLSSLTVQGTLGLVTLNGDVFLCVVTGSSKAATVRPGENVQRISPAASVVCLNSSICSRIIGRMDDISLSQLIETKR